MYRKFNQLSFIIGLFFFIVSVILAVNALWLQSGARMNLYTAVVFFAFGLFMMLLKDKATE